MTSLGSFHIFGPISDEERSTHTESIERLLEQSCDQVSGEDKLMAQFINEGIEARRRNDEFETGRPSQGDNPQGVTPFQLRRPPRIPRKRKREPLQYAPNGKKICWISKENELEQRVHVNKTIFDSFELVQCSHAHNFQSALATTKIKWWEAFQQKWTWYPCVTETGIYKLWKKKAKRRYDDKLCKARRLDECPSFIQIVHWQAWKNGIWSTSEFIERSNTNKANRAKNPAVHTGGTLPHREHAHILAEALGREPHSYEVMAHTHSAKHDWVTMIDRRSAQVSANFQMIVQSQQTATPGSEPDYDTAYLEAAGGIKPGGAVFGLGTQAKVIYKERIAARQGGHVQYLQADNDNLRALVQSLQDQLARSQHDRGQSSGSSSRATSSGGASDLASPPSERDT